MSPIEIVIIILAVSFVLYIFGKEIYKIIHHKPTDTCEECHDRMKMAVKRMRKEQLKKKKKALKEAKASKLNN